MKINFYSSCAAWLGRWVRRPRACTPEAPALSDKILVQLGDGRCALADDDDHAQALVMNECLRSGAMISANFRPATVDEVAALSSPNVGSQPRAGTEK